MSRDYQPRGVENPRIIDLITLDESTGEVVLVMLERRPWGQPEGQLEELDAKLNSYYTYVVDGHLAREYPQYAGLEVRVQLECRENPGERQRPILRAAEEIGRTHGIRFVVNVMEDPTAHRAPWESDRESS